jgi:hypothetical protein
MKNDAPGPIRFGLHYDMHVGADDTLPGTGISVDYLEEIFERLQVDFVQTDTKGHPGYTSWFSTSIPESVPQGLTADQLEIWRLASRSLGLSLHCHYSGIYERRAAELHPDWRVKSLSSEIPGDSNGQNAGAPPEAVLCPRSPYLDEYMIPQLKELVDRYDVDGFWIDGDLWAAQPCYCPRCTRAFRRRTGIERPPVATTDPDWAAWMNFVRESFEEYVTRYADAVHEHAPGVRVCSNWLQTLRHPGEPNVPTDWISGDNTWVFGYDDARVEAKFLATRGKPWDVMIWNFYKMRAMRDHTVPWSPKPPQMVMQEAAMILAHGGSVQVYENGAGIRDGRFVPWRIEALQEVATFVGERKDQCADTQTLPQAVVLHSEHHARRHMGANLMWGVDVSSVRGATYALLENHIGVDVMDEWALLPRLSEFPLVVVPEQAGLSSEAVAALTEYTVGGGTLLLSGPALLSRFSDELRGARIAGELPAGTLHVPVASRMAAMHSEAWLEVVPLEGTAVLSRLHRLPIHGEAALDAPAATLSRHGRGSVLCFTGELFSSYFRTRYPDQRALVGDLLRRAGVGLIDARAPIGVDLIYRTRDDVIQIHAVNRLSGTLTSANDGAVTEIPPIGPVHIDLRSLPGTSSAPRIRRPLGTEAAVRGAELVIPRIGIHEIVEIDAEKRSVSS